MKRRKKRMLLTLIIVVLVIALIVMIAGIVLEEKRNTKNKAGEELEASDANVSASQEDSAPPEEVQEGEDEDVTEDVNDEVKTEQKEPEYVGEEENAKQEDDTQNIEQKVIDAVKKQWGDDNSVTFTIEKKNGTKYRVAVRDASTTVLQWYEVDTEDWDVSEY